VSAGGEADIQVTGARGYLHYRRLDFGRGATGITLQAASHDPVTAVEVRLDRQDGPVAGVCQVLGPIEDKSAPAMCMTGLYGASGVHDLYLVLRRGSSVRMSQIALTADGDPVAISSLQLPPQVPYLGREQPYFVGTGKTGGGGDIHGVWDFLIGPTYTSPDFLEQEKLGLVVDGVPAAIDVTMRRARGSGVLYGQSRAGDLVVRIVDFGLANEPYVARLVAVTNASANASHSVQAEAKVRPSAKKAEILDGSALELSHDTTSTVFGDESDNWAERRATIAWSGPAAASSSGDGFRIVTQAASVGPGASQSFGLYHWLYFANKGGHPPLESIRARDIERDLGATMREWSTWLAQGNTPPIADVRTADIVEAGLVFLRMQQCEGGFIAGVRRYAHSYMRDGHGACRGLLATGHTREVREFLSWVHHKYEVFHQIVNAAQMGSDALSFLPGNTESETPAYYLMTARNYYDKTKDLAFLRSIESSLKYAAEAQLTYAKAHGYKLRFNGDETEQYVPTRDGQTYGGFPALPNWDKNDWSMTSLAACIASLDFYRDFLQNTGRADEAAALASEVAALRRSLEETFWRQDTSRYDWVVDTDTGRGAGYPVTDFHMMPVWFGLSDDRGHGASSVMATLAYRTDEGFLPIAPGKVDGLCGHSLGILLRDLVVLKSPAAALAFEPLVRGELTDAWGTYSEFYGPRGLSNGHNLRPFESGINVEAILDYVRSQGDPASRDRSQR
jgi:hypothetical protein